MEKDKELTAEQQQLQLDAFCRFLHQSELAWKAVQNMAACFNAYFMNQNNSNAFFKMPMASLTEIHAAARSMAYASEYMLKVIARNRAE